MTAHLSSKHGAHQGVADPEALVKDISRLTDWINPMTAPVSTRHPALRGARLDLAAAVLDDPSLLPAGVSARTCTVLIRLAIERSLDDYWRRNLPELRTASRRAQIRFFGRRVNAELGRRFHQLWSELGRAAHDQARELNPTAGELRAWHREAVAVAAGLHGIQPPAPAPAQRSASAPASAPAPAPAQRSALAPAPAPAQRSASAPAQRSAAPNIRSLVRGGQP